ncbi:copper amine oxidase N-terminal domain-containing protein [Paenibacillus pini]|uniref:Copper amine oxidase n=1 Tax=Paenibacillus pini JCM 16418 TaxID=1236976 RepID=W7YUX4_9BACL|nr:copper amine oxidase N-terminal domain-containing protein [Paenibacillus pini]GAF06249.1 copper amine oxidase [Paenibacillus pini JCM 16418]
MKYMKKVKLSILTSVLAVGLTIGGTVGNVHAAESKGNIEVLLNAKKISFPDAKPYQDSQGSVMVPIRFVSEALGAEVGWTKANGQLTVELKNTEHTVNMTVGKATATIDGNEKSYGTKIVLQKNRTFVPLRLVSEGLGQTVEWDKISRWVWIGKKNALTLEEAGLKPVSLDPYRKWFSKAKDLLKSPREDINFNEVLIFKVSDLPTKFLREIYSVELYSESKTNASYLKVRAKTSSGSGDIFYLTKKNDIRYRNPMSSLTINNGDGTKYCFYKIWSPADKTLNGIVDQSPLKIQDIEYIGFYGGTQNYIPLMINPWKGN